MKKTLAILLAAVMLLGLAAIGGASAAGEEIVLQYWNPFTGGTNPDLDALFARFNEENAGSIRLEVNAYAAEDLYPKFMTSASAGSGLPDVMAMHVERVGMYGSMGLLKDLTAKAEEFGLTEDMFMPAVWESAVIDGKVSAIPRDIHSFIMYYNNTLLEELGYTKADLEDYTFDDLMEMAAACDALGEDYYGISLSGAAPDVMNRLFLSSYYQNDGVLLDTANPGVATLDNDQTRLAFEQMQAMAPLTVPEGTGGRPFFMQGNVLFHFNGTWEFLNFIDVSKEDLDWDTTFLPLFGDTKTCWSGVHMWTIPEQEMDEDRLNACMTFIKFMSDNLIINDGVPVRLDSMNSETFESSPFAFMKDYVDDITLPPNVQTLSELYDVLQPKLTDVYWGRVTPEMFDDYIKTMNDEATEKMSMVLQ